MKFLLLTGAAAALGVKRESSRVRKKTIAARVRDINKGDRIMIITSTERDNGLSRVGAPQRILQSVLEALNQGRILQAVDQFDDDLAFNDHALGLDFTDKGRLTEFFEKSREYLPDAAVEVISIFECGDRVVAEWKLNATETVPFGPTQHRNPISVRGTSIVQIRNGRVTRWSDYYDSLASRLFKVAAFFKEWVEL
jgi:steroid delta-isomerase-like uncharacterized protein